MVTVLGLFSSSSPIAPLCHDQVMNRLVHPIILYTKSYDKQVRLPKSDGIDCTSVECKIIHNNPSEKV